MGLARKTGMDEAVRRFNSTEKPDGVIVCLDADCIVQENYFQTLYAELLERKDRNACSIYFEHPLSGNEYSKEIYASVTQYELHLRYYVQALRYSSFPYIFHTIGSIIAVKSQAYVKVGGMNRRKAGEDFYFIQKLVSSGSYFNLNTTTVYPSPRISRRVPFGTGPVVERMVSSGEKCFMTYNPLAFRDIYSFFSLIEKLYRGDAGKWNSIYRNLPEGVISFINEVEWISRLSEIKNNTSGLISFRKRFFNWFNMFKVVKYLNYVHHLIYSKVPVEIAAAKLLEYTGKDFISKDPYELLLFYRSMERGS